MQTFLSGTSNLQDVLSKTKEKCKMVPYVYIYTYTYVCMYIYLYGLVHAQSMYMKLIRVATAGEMNWDEMGEKYSG